MLIDNSALAYYAFNKLTAVRTTHVSLPAVQCESRAARNRLSGRTISIVVPFLTPSYFSLPPPFSLTSHFSRWFTLAGSWCIDLICFFHRYTKREHSFFVLLASRLFINSLRSRFALDEQIFGITRRIMNGSFLHQWTSLADSCRAGLGNNTVFHYCKQQWYRQSLTTLTYK